MRRDQYSKWNSVKVKAKYDYTCAKCSSMENIQAHDPTGKHNDWRQGIALCGSCHSLEHPNVPRNLFSLKTHQPYWPNISARSLAKEFGCHNRTIIRRAQQLEILAGEVLSESNRKLLELSYRHQRQRGLREYLTETITNEPPICTKCDIKMHKAGKVQLLYNRIQRYKCSKCGTTTIKENKAEYKT